MHLLRTEKVNEVGPSAGPTSLELDLSSVCSMCTTQLFFFLSEKTCCCLTFFGSDKFPPPHLKLFPAATNEEVLGFTKYHLIGENGDMMTHVTEKLNFCLMCLTFTFTKL